MSLYTPCIRVIDKNLTSFCIILVLVPSIIYLITAYIPGGVTTVYQGNTIPKEGIYNQYTKGNFSCTLSIQPWYQAQSTTPLVVLAYGSRVKELLESAFRVKVGSSTTDLLSQHYLYIQVSTLKEIFDVKPSPPKKVLYLYSTPLRDFTDFSFRKELRGGGYGAVKTFISDWEYTSYVTQHSTSQFYSVNVTTFTDKDLIELLYVSLPYTPYHPLSTYTTCAYSISPTTQESTFYHRCLMYSKTYPLLNQGSSTRVLLGGEGGGGREEEEERCKLFT